MEVITHRSLDSPGIRHGLFTRRGGLSRGAFESLNCGFGSGDETEIVAENRARAARHLGIPGTRLLTAHQTHSRRALLVDAAWRWDEAPETDALVTRTAGLAVGVLTADCAPVLLADAGARVVAAVHAGWRGALEGVLEAAVETMIEAGAEAARIAAVIGPCIGCRSYEVGPEFRARFVALDPRDADLFQPSARPEHYLFDLEGFVVRRLSRLGLKEIAPLSLDSYADEARFFSYRRVYRSGGTRYGRLLSAIVLEP